MPALFTSTSIGPERAPRRGEERVDRRRAAHVERVRERRAARVAHELRGLLELLGPARAERDRPAEPAERDRDRPADAGRRAGDDRDARRRRRQPSHSPPLTSSVWPVITRDHGDAKNTTDVRDVVLRRDQAERDARLDLAAHDVGRDVARARSPSG